MRVAIVNDMRMAVEALRRIVVACPEHAIAWIARDGAEAAAKCAADTPDVILMDLIMPVMNGVEATREIMRHSPCAILVVTATVDGNIALVFEAMGHGALDAVNTPVLGPDGRLRGAEELRRKLALIGHLIGRPPDSAPPPPSTAAARATGAPLVLFGASTGGPAALSDIFSGLPPDMPAALVAVQHVDAQFAPDLAAWLNRRGRCRVAVAEPGRPPPAGMVSLACTNDHLVFAPDGALQYVREPQDCFYRPSVDVFFRSAARHCPAGGVAVLLTGMGRDGGAGLLELRRRGWSTIAQDEHSSVVYGMPRAAAELGAAAEIRPLGEIADAVAQAVQRRNR